MSAGAKRFSPVMALERGVTLLEASAGTGKTYSITSLYLRLVAEEGLGVDEILVVTFTVAATAELKERIRKRLREATQALDQVLAGLAAPDVQADEVLTHLASAPGPTLAERVERLRAAVARMDDAAISTIHGFCQRMLQRHPVETRVDLDAEVAEEDQAFLDEAMDDAYAAAMNGLDPGLAAALRHHNFRETLRKTMEGLRNHPDATLVESPAGDEAEPDVGAWCALFCEFRDDWQRWEHDALETQRAAIKARVLDGQKYQARWIEGRARKVRTWLEATTVPFSDLPDQLAWHDSDTIRSATKEGCKPPEHPLFHRVTRFREAVSGLNSRYRAFQARLAQRLVEDIRARFAARKRRARVWSFQDLLVLLRDALRDEVHGEALARAIRGQFRAALIDEFQDTDGVQWEVFRRVFRSPEHFLFLIGDPKQAIYSFRGADIHAYLAAREEADRRFTLPVNWRSDGRLVQALNTLYGRATRPFWDAGIAYDEVEVPPEHRDDRLRDPGRRHAPLVIRVVRRSDFSIEGTRPIPKNAVEPCLPEVVADDAARLLASAPEVLESDGWKPLRPGHIAVLVRKHEQAWAVQRALRARGIPCVLHSEANVFRSEAATDLALVLWAIVDPDDRAAVRSALTTRLFGMTVPEVLDIEAREEEWSRLDHDLRRWEAAWRERGFSPMFRAMLHERAVLPRLVGLAGGERVVTDLLHLAEMIQVAESGQRLGPEALLAWFLRERSRPTLSSDARQIRLESDEDAVEVVTMHHAKGLEYPVVFCPYLWDGLLLANNTVAVRYHDGADGRLRVSIRSVSPEDEWGQAWTATEREVFAENLRMAYVALTRARHQTFVYWVPSWKGGGEASALGWLLFPPADPGDGQAIPCRYMELDDAAAEAELSALPEASNDTIAVAAVDWTREAPRYRPPAGEGARAVAATPFPPGEFDRSWQWTSFTRLVAGHGGEEPGDDDVVRASRPEGEGDALLRDFPRGRMAGRCLHTVFERLDFACDDPEPVIREVLAEYGLDVEGLSGSVSEAVLGALRTPLPSPDGPVRLRDVPRSDRMNEVSFLFPVAGGLLGRCEAVSPEDLARAFERHGGALGGRFAASVRDLPAPSVRGFLSGQMDLVFRVGSRWYLADYKSNDLGPRLADYAPPALDREMLASRYFLQYHLYAVALHRHASSRTPGFDWDRDFGGVFYLFLRGLDGSGRTGVFHDRPSAALVEALCGAFGSWG